MGDKMVLKVKLRASGKRLTPYISSVVTSGKVQKAFTEKIGHKVGACVKAGVSKGMKVSEIREVVRRCAKKHAANVKLFKR